MSVTSDWFAHAGGLSTSCGHLLAGRGRAYRLERSFHGRPRDFPTQALVCRPSRSLMLVTMDQAEWFAAEGPVPSSRVHSHRQIPDPPSNVSSRAGPCVIELPGGTARVSQTFPPMLEPRPMVMRPRIVAPA